MSRRKSQRATELKNPTLNPEPAPAVPAPSQSVLPPTPPIIQPTPVMLTAVITVTGTLFDGTKKSQDMNVKFRPGQNIGEVMWTAIETLKRVGGLIEDTDTGVTFYPLHVLEGGVTFAEKRMVTADASRR